MKGEVKAIVKTKSNCNNCNGKLLKVIRANKGFFDIEIPRYGFDPNGNPQGEIITATFELQEIVSIVYNYK